MTNVVALVQRPVRQSVITALEMALERAHSGELQGVVLLLNQGVSVSSIAAGIYGISDMVMAYKDWEFRELAQRNLVCPNCGHDDRTEH